MEYLRGKLRGRISTDTDSSSRRIQVASCQEDGGSLWTRRDSAFSPGNRRQSSASGSGYSVVSRGSQSRAEQQTCWEQTSRPHSGYKPYTASTSATSTKIRLSLRDRGTSRYEERDLRPAYKSFYSPLRERKSKENHGASNDQIDYKTLFEKERQERQMCEKKLHDLEHQQMVLENNLKKFLDLKREFSFLQHEAEESDKVVNDFIKAVVPSFSSISRTKKYSEFSDCNQETIEDVSSFQDEVVSIGAELPLPNTQYQWGSASTGSYLSSTTSRMVDELQLNLVFDVNSHLLPTKLHLEIKDKNGRVVFRKRQNLYYVKVQERVSTLDAECDYIMTVTTITGPAKTSADVRIHNKHHVPEEEDEEDLDELVTMTPSCTLPMLDTSSRESSGFDERERSLDTIFDSPLRHICAARDEVAREVSETPLPDLEEVVTVDLTPVTVTMEEAQEEVQEVVEEVERRNPFLLVRRPLVPDSVLYKWQRGFRRDATGRYNKVTILRLQLQYDEAVVPLLPASLVISSTKDPALGKTVEVSGGSASTEIIVSDPDTEADMELRVESVDKQAPVFSLVVGSLTGATLGDWHPTQPVLVLQL